MIPAQFNPKDVEQKWYDYWMKNNYFHSTPDHRTPYTIVIPPPNVTGVLHMGHMLNNTIQDVLIRRARLKGLNACWVPVITSYSIHYTKLYEPEQLLRLMQLQNRYNLHKMAPEL